jgi:drug/metabolite transporter (DMT)-like permease
VPTLLGLLLIGYAARTIGSNTTSTRMAAVPGVGTVLGILFLDEILKPIGWIALLTLTIGIIVTSLPKKKIATL